MIRPLLYVLSFTLFAACSAASETETSEEVTETIEAPVIEETLSAAEALGVENGVMITVDRLISEEAACLVMMNVANGTDQTVTAGLFAFDVTGNGERAGANMFPQTTQPGDVVTAQIILPSASCENAKVIEGGQINCRFVVTGESCIDTLELRDGIVDFTLND